MENKILKLSAQLTVLFVVAYVAVRALTPQPKKCSQSSGGGNSWGRQKARGDVWNHTPVAAPSGEEGLSFGPAPIF
jgi:hypothetical protein